MKQLLLSLLFCLAILTVQAQVGDSLWITSPSVVKPCQGSGGNRFQIVLKPYSTTDTLGVGLAVDTVHINSASFLGPQVNSFQIVGKSTPGQILTAWYELEDCSIAFWNNYSQIVQQQFRLSAIQSIIQHVKIYSYTSHTFVNSPFYLNFDSQQRIDSTIRFDVYFPFFSDLTSNISLSQNKGDHFYKDFVFQNQGPDNRNSAFTGYFQFSDSSLCNAVSIDSIRVTAGHQLLYSGSYSSDSIVAFMVNDSILPIGITTSDSLRSLISIREYMHIVDCLDPCDSLSYSSVYHFNEGCSSSLICKDISSHYSVTRNNNRIPYLVYSRLTPVPVNPSFNDAVWENSCPGSLTTWSYRIKNTGTATAYNTTIKLFCGVSNPYIYVVSKNGSGQNTLYTIQNSVTTSAARHLWSFGNGNKPNCFVQDSALYQPADTVTYLISQLDTGEFADIYFTTLRCCPNDTSQTEISLFNEPINFNKWRLQLYANSECDDPNGIIHSIHPTAFVDHSNGLYNPITENQTNSISLNKAIGNDLWLQQQLFPVSDMTGITHPIPACNQNAASLFTIYNVLPTDWGVNTGALFSQLYNPNEDSIFIHGRIKIYFTMMPGLQLTIPNGSGPSIYFSNGSNLWIPDTVSPIFGGCNSVGNNAYTAIFNFSDTAGQYCLPLMPGNLHRNSLKNFRDFFNYSTFSFYLKPCCCSADGLNTYSVSTFLNADPSACTDCWMPLAQVASYVNVHCPGCVTPGIAVNNFHMERSSNASNGTFSYGWKDANDNGRIDTGSVNTRRIDSLYLSQLPVRRNFSMHGDFLISTVDASFQEGDNSNSAGGILYHQLLNCFQDTFNFLYLNQTIPNADLFGVQPYQSCTLQIIRPDSSSYVSCQLPLVGNQNHYINLTIPLSEIHSFGDTVFWYNLSMARLRANNPNMPGCYQFEPGDYFHLETYFKVCGNYQTASTNDPSVCRHESAIQNVMFITGIPYDSMPAPSQLGHLWAGDSWGLDSLANASVCSSFDSVVTPASLYKCQTFGGYHYFLEIKAKPTLTIGNNTFGLSGHLKCHKYLIGELQVTIGGSGVNVFPFEFRPAPVDPILEVDLNSINHFPLNLERGGTYFHTYRDGCVPYSEHISRIFSPLDLQLNSCTGLLICSDTVGPLPGSLSFSRNFPYTFLSDSSQYDLCPNPCLIAANNEMKNCTPQQMQGDEYFKQSYFLSFNSPCSSIIDSQAVSVGVLKETFTSLNCVSGNDTVFAPAQQNSYFKSPDPRCRIEIVGNNFLSDSSSLSWQIKARDSLDYAENFFIYLPQPDSNLTFYGISGYRNFDDTNWVPIVTGRCDSTGGCIYNLGTLQGNTSNSGINFTINAQSNRCDTSGGTMAIPLYWGWNCEGTPASYQTACFRGVDTLKFHQARPQFRDSLFISPATFNLCDTSVLTVKIQTTGSGRFYHPVIHMQSDSLIQRDSGYVLVANADTISMGLPQITGDSLDLSSVFPNGISDGDIVLIHFYYIPQCGYSGSNTPYITISRNLFCDPTVSITDTLRQNWSFGYDSCHCQPPFTILTSMAPTVCSQGKAVISASASGGTSPYTYSWSQSAGTTDTVSVYPVVTTTYTVTITDALGVTATATVIVYVTQASTGQCCVPTGFAHGVDFDYSGLHSSSLGYDSITTAQIILINDTFTVDHDFAFRSCTNIVMGPNAVINVLTGIHFILYDSHVYSCNQMSQGLISQRTSFVTIFGSTIENAVYGIQANDGTYLEVNQAVFNNDYIGIYCPKDSASGSTIVYGHVINSTFSCTGTLHLPTPYPQPMPLNFSKTFAGIYLEDNAFFDIGSGSTYPNIFDGLNNGVRAMRSNVNVERSRFLRIQNYDNITFGGGSGVSSAFCNGSGVYVNGISGYSALTQRGLDNPALNDFVDCNYAVVAFASNIKSSKNYVLNCDWGIRSAWSRNNDVLILENHLDCNKYGIVLQFTDGTLHTKIYHNEIDIGSRHALNGSTSISGRGVYIWENQGINPNSSLERNIVRLHNYGKNGIEITGAYNYLIDHNSVQMGVHSSNVKGIVLHLSDFNTLSCNNVYGLNNSYSNPSESAMEFWDSKSNVINCNSLDNTFNGLVFVANCAGGGGNETVVRANDFNDHYNGLLYTGSAHVDEQVCKGNWWWKNVYGGYAAQNLNLASALNEKIFVDSSGQTFSNGANHTNFPDSLEIDPTFWFGSRPQIDDSCNIDTTHHSECSLIPYYSKESSNLYLDILAAQNQIESSEFDEQAKWKARVALYEKLLKQPEYLDSSQYLADFYINMAGTMIQHIAKINVEHESLFSNQETASTLVEQNSFQIYTQSEMIRLCDSLLAGDSLANQIRDSLKFQVQNLRSSIANLIHFNLAALRSIDSTIAIDADLLNTANEEIVSNKVYEFNQGIVNEIRIKCTEIIRPDSLQSYTSELISMAEQCPLSGGPAVYLARSLYSWLNLDVEYDDAQICIQNGLVLRKRNDSFLPELTVFPNPAGNELNLNYTIQDDLFFDLIDQLGRSVLSERLRKEGNLKTIKTEFLTPGVYFYLLHSENGLLLPSGRVVILRN